MVWRVEYSMALEKESCRILRRRIYGALLCWRTCVLKFQHHERIAFSGTTTSSPSSWSACVMVNLDAITLLVGCTGVLSHRDTTTLDRQGHSFRIQSRRQDGPEPSPCPW